MSTAPITVPDAPVQTVTGPDSSVDDLMSELGLEAEKPGAAAAPVGDKPADKPAKEGPGEAAAPDAKADDKAEDDAEPDKAAAGDEDPDQEKLRGIMARSRARRREREAREAAQRPQDKPAPATAAAPDKKPESPAAAAAQPTTGVRDAVKDVLLQLDKLAADDQAAPPPGQTTAQADAASAKRGEEMAALREKIDGIAAALEKGDPELRERVEKLSGALERMETDRHARSIVTAAVDAIEADLPKLHDPAILRTLRRPDGTRYRDPAEVVHEAAVKFWAKYKVAPDLKLLARRIEKSIPGASPEKPDTSTAGNGTEKPTQSRKTVSRNHGSPPAARTGPDARSKTEAEEDFFGALGIDPHD